MMRMERTLLVERGNLALVDQAEDLEQDRTRLRLDGADGDVVGLDNRSTYLLNAQNSGR